LAAPYNVDGGDSIWAKVSAVNAFGESARSTEGNGAVYSNVPNAPVNLQEDISAKIDNNVKLTWDDGPNNGGLTIIDYRVNTQNLQGDWVELVSGVSDRTYTISSTQLGTTFYFAVEARNVLGYSVFSDTLQVLNALVPEKPVAPTTTNNG
jgi:hypothetical protein